MTMARSHNDPGTKATGGLRRRVMRLLTGRREVQRDGAGHTDTTFLPRAVETEKRMAPYILDQEEVAEAGDVNGHSSQEIVPVDGAPVSGPTTMTAPLNKTNAGRASTRVNNTLEIYTEYFGLTARPFTLVPDPDFLFWSPSHKRAYAMLEYGIVTCAPITLITGEVGSGKTTILHHLLKKMETGIKVGLVSNAQGSRGELLRWVLMALGQKTSQEDTYVDLFERFQLYLIEEYARGNRVVIIFDEAQNLGRESLEELRMFTNINSNKDELLQLVLVGQPELRDIVRRPDLRQFAQRVVANFHLDSMDSKTVREYIAHRLAKAGATRSIFNRPACELIYENTGGVPRLVNQLCDLAMVYTFTNSQKIVTARIIQQVLDDGAFFGAGAYDRGEPIEPC